MHDTKNENFSPPGFCAPVLGAQTIRLLKMVKACGIIERHTKNNPDKWIVCNLLVIHRIFQIQVITSIKFKAPSIR